MTDIDNHWTKYEGNFRNGIREGYGTILFLDGS
jgi:hypothetical protein